MEVQVNWWAVLLAAASSMVVGSIWYAKPVFGTLWMKLVKLDAKKLRQGSYKELVTAFVMSLLTAFVVAHVSALSVHFFGTTTLEAGITTAFWLWLGIAVTTVATHDAFEQRPLRLTLLTIGNRGVTILLMGLIIGWLGGF